MVSKAVGQASLVEALLPAAIGGNKRLARIVAQGRLGFDRDLPALSLSGADRAACPSALGPAEGVAVAAPARSPDRACSAAGLAGPADRQGYLLSDRDLKEALADRLSFRRFCGLGREDTVPDATTLSRFRIDLAEAGLGAVHFSDSVIRFASSPASCWHKMSRAYFGGDAADGGAMDAKDAPDPGGRLTA